MCVLCLSIFNLNCIENKTGKIRVIQETQRERELRGSGNMCSADGERVLMIIGGGEQKVVKERGYLCTDILCVLGGMAIVEYVLEEDGEIKHECASAAENVRYSL